MNISISRIQFLTVLCTFYAGTGMADSLKSATEIWQNLLNKYVTEDGGVDYKGFAKEKGKLEEIDQLFGKADPAKWSQSARKAAYINYYNSTMILSLLNWADANQKSVDDQDFIKLEIASLSNVSGSIWKDKKYGANLGGKRVTLDNLEHQLIRKNSPGDLKAWAVDELDARIHAAVNCAALSCPYLRKVAFTESNVDAELQKAMEDYASGSQYFSKASDTKMSANSIVKWYYKDFEVSGKKLKLGGAGGYLASFVKKDSKDAEWKKNHFNKTFNGRWRISLETTSDYEFSYRWLINDIRNK